MVVTACTDWVASVIMSSELTESEISVATRQDTTIEMVRLVMRVRNVTFGQLAEGLRKSRPAIHAYFRKDDPSAVTVDMLDGMARVLDVPIGLLLSENASTVLSWLAENADLPGDQAQRRLCLYDDVMV